MRIVSDAGAQPAPPTTGAPGDVHRGLLSGQPCQRAASASLKVADGRIAAVVLASSTL